MAGWHTRFWRRVRVAPGVTINLSKSGPSLSVGPRGSKITFGRRGVRQTIGLPGTGLYASRQLSSTPAWGRPAERQPATPAIAVQPAEQPALAATDAATVRYEIHYGLPFAAALAIGVILGIYGQPTSLVVGGAIVAFCSGLSYEAFAAHHPAAAKVIVQLVVAIIAIASIVAAILLVALAAVAGLSTQGRRRR